MRAFLVLGPVSSGTRLLTRLLIMAGCKGCDKHDQPFDEKLPADEPLIVWRRSVPHGAWRLPDIQDMRRRLKHRGYEATVIIMSRDWYPTASSIVKYHPPETMNEAYDSIQNAYRFIFASIDGLPYELVNYEALVLSADDVIQSLFGRLGLPSPGDVDIYNGNEKYYPLFGEVVG